MSTEVAGAACPNNVPEKKDVRKKGSKVHAFIGNHISRFFLTLDKQVIKMNPFPSSPFSNIIIDYLYF